MHSTVIRGSYMQFHCTIAAEMGKYEALSKFNRVQLF